MVHETKIIITAYYDDVTKEFSTKLQCDRAKIPPDIIAKTLMGIVKAIEEKDPAKYFEYKEYLS